MQRLDFAERLAALGVSTAMYEPADVDAAKAGAR